MKRLLKRIQYCIGWMAYKIDCAKAYYLQKHNENIVHLGMGSSIGAAVTLGCPQNITIGSNSYINGGDLIASPHSKIIIGDDCLISYRVHLRTDMHCYKKGKQLIRKQGHREASITIGNDVWIGYGAQIMAGVSVADGTVVGAGAVVTHDTQAYGVYAGVPARMIGKREQGCAATDILKNVRK